MDMSASDEKELRRVYDFLCGYLPKSKLLLRKPLRLLLYVFSSIRRTLILFLFMILRISGES